MEHSDSSATAPTDQDLNRWVDAWQGNKTGWHRSDINPNLLRNASSIVEKDAASKQPPPRVFVPLCGKTKDILFFTSNGYKVIANEFVEKAVREFFEENKIPLASSSSSSSNNNNNVVENKNGFKVYKSQDGNIEFYQGDYFKITPELVGGQVDYIYDRASLVAIEPHLRKQYAQVARGLLKPGGKILLVATAYNQEGMQGPPFSVSESDVRALYEDGGDFTVEKLSSVDLLGVEPPFNKPSLTFALEATYLLTMKANH